MPLKLKQRPGVAAWYLRGTVNGHRYDESTGVTEKGLAEQLRIKREYELQREAIHGPESTKTFAQAALAYLEQGGNKRYMQKVLLELGADRLSSIGQARVDRCALKLYPGCAPSTWARQVYHPVSVVLFHAARLGWCPKPVLKRPTAPPGRVRWIDHDTADRLLAACAPHLARLVLFLLYTGARVGEALWLDWKDVDLERKQVQFLNTKNGTSRGVPLHTRVVQMLRGSNERTGCVFRTDDGSEYAKPKRQGAEPRGGQIKTAFKAACRRAKLSDFHPHDCRHTWATWHYIANRDLGALQRLGGWKTLAMVMRYAHVNVDELATTIDRM